MLQVPYWTEACDGITHPFFWKSYSINIVSTVCMENKAISLQIFIQVMEKEKKLDA